MFSNSIKQNRNNSFQIISSISLALSVNYPYPYDAVMSYFSAFEFGFLSIECLDGAYYWSVYFTSAVPIFLSAFNWIVYLLRLGEDALLGDIDEDIRNSLFSEHMHAFLLIICRLSPFQICANKMRSHLLAMICCTTSQIALCLPSLKSISWPSIVWSLRMGKDIYLTILLSIVIVMIIRISCTFIWQ